MGGRREGKRGGGNGRGRRRGYVKGGRRRDEKGWLTRLKEDGDGGMKGEEESTRKSIMENEQNNWPIELVSNGVRRGGGVNVT